MGLAPTNILPWQERCLCLSQCWYAGMGVIFLLCLRQTATGCHVKQIRFTFIHLCLFCLTHDFLFYFEIHAPISMSDKLHFPLCASQLSDCICPPWLFPRVPRYLICLPVCRCIYSIYISIYRLFPFILCQFVLSSMRTSLCLLPRLFLKSGFAFTLILCLLNFFSCPGVQMLFSYFPLQSDLFVHSLLISFLTMQFSILIVVGLLSPLSLCLLVVCLFELWY